MNFSTAIVLIIVLAIVSAIALQIIKKKRSGESSCSCGNCNGHCTCNK